MESSTVRERILNMLDGERTGEMFCSCHLTSVTTAQMEAINVYWPDAHLDPDLHVKLAESQYTLLGFQSVRSGFDVGIEAESLGAEVNMGSKDSNVYVTKPAFDEPESFFIPENYFELGRFPIHFKALSILKEKYHDKVPVYALLLGPLTLMGILFGVEKIMRWTRKEPDLFKKLLEKVTDVVANYGNRLIETGADALSLGDPTASGNLISPIVFKKFLFPMYGKLSEEIKGRVILHVCGDTTLFLKTIAETGFCGFSFEGPAVEVKKAKEIIGNRMALFGNVPTVDVLMYGTIEDVRRWTMRAIQDGIDSVEPACALPLQTPIANVRAISETVREYNKQKGFD
ncbi:MtaA/CmuA family methyltransferase [bacterium]|nr:MtaA/CmuA family methyltransferase [bacterium]